MRHLKVTPFGGLSKQDDQYRAPDGSFSMTPDEINGMVTYFRNLMEASMLTNEKTLADAYQVLFELWSARAATAAPNIQQPVTISYDPAEINDLLESVGLPPAIYKGSDPASLIKIESDVSALLASVGL